MRIHWLWQRRHQCNSAKPFIIYDHEILLETLSIFLPYLEWILSYSSWSTRTNKALVRYHHLIPQLPLLTLVQSCFQSLIPESLLFKLSRVWTWGTRGGQGELGVEKEGEEKGSNAMAFHGRGDLESTHFYIPILNQSFSSQPQFLLLPPILPGTFKLWALQLKYLSQVLRLNCPFFSLGQVLYLDRLSSFQNSQQSLVNSFLFLSYFFDLMNWYIFNSSFFFSEVRESRYMYMFNQPT